LERVKEIGWEGIDCIGVGQVVGNIEHGIRNPAPSNWEEVFD
jgi:hypothetical protein